MASEKKLRRRNGARVVRRPVEGSDEVRTEYHVGFHLYRDVFLARLLLPARVATAAVLRSRVCVALCGVLACTFYAVS